MKKKMKKNAGSLGTIETNGIGSERGNRMIEKWTFCQMFKETRMSFDTLSVRFEALYFIGWFSWFVDMYPDVSMCQVHVCVFICVITCFFFNRITQLHIQTEKERERTLMKFWIITLKSCGPTCYRGVRSKIF